MEGQPAALLKCQRIGCNATFSDDDNPEGSCQYHASGPIFHDGIKEWSCCKKKSHDFSLFLELEGQVNTRQRNQFWQSRNQVLLFPFLLQLLHRMRHQNSPALGAYRVSSVQIMAEASVPFPGSQAKEMNSKPVNVTTMPLPESITDDQGTSVRPKKIIDINQPQTCKNKGCGQTFKEKDNHETACNYHPGPAVFHDRVRGWKCCDIHVKEFDEFVSIPPCTKGWHNADPVP